MLSSLSSRIPSVDGDPLLPRHPVAAETAAEVAAEAVAEAVAEAAAAEATDMADMTDAEAAEHQRLFKKHKILPHPRKDVSYAALRGPRPIAPARQLDAISVAAAAAIKSALPEYAYPIDSQLSSIPRTFKNQTKTSKSGPDLPPTPPAHSRNSSSSYSVLPPSATDVQSPERSAEDVQINTQLPTTPTKQMSPPTPDVTPPNVAESQGRVKEFPPLRSVARERELSKGTTDSRSESFKTAQEHVSSGDEEDADGRSTLQLVAPSAKTSESTVRRLEVSAHVEDQGPNGDSHRHAASYGATSSGNARRRQPVAVGLGLGLESSPDEDSTSSSRRDFVSFDGEWGMSQGNGAAMPEWDGGLHRNVATRQRDGPEKMAKSRQEVVEDVMVSPTNATQALRSMSLPQRILTFPSPNETPDQRRLFSTPHQQKQPQPQPLASAASITASIAAKPAPHSPPTSERDRRASTMSSKSTVSTVIEAYLVDTPPQRRRTLRHVKKQLTLRDSVSDLSPTSSAPTSVLDEGVKVLPQQGQPQLRSISGRYTGKRQDSMVSTLTVASIAGRAARRDILRAGAIPVLVVPERRSSARSTSREPSLRSTSSHRSKHSQSAVSVPLSQFSHFSRSSQLSNRPGRDGGVGHVGDVGDGEYPPNASRQSRRRSRAYSESDGSAPGDQRTMDFPPVVPKRTSSLSAPTSRNPSRSGSMTTESVKAHAELLQSKLETKALEQRLALSELSREEGLDKTATDPDLQGRDPLPIREDMQPAEQTTRPTLEITVDDAPAYDHAESLFTHYDMHLDHRSRLDPRANHSHNGGDVATQKHLSPQNTPFSVTSVETATSHHSHAEVSEAMAVSIFAHQNTSILMVDHSTRPSDSSDDSQPDRTVESAGSNRSKRAADHTPMSKHGYGRDVLASMSSVSSLDGPVTPPQPIFSMKDVDSPLRNPRAPPAPPVSVAPPGPPAINFIPATPSGMTPATVREEQQRDPFGEELHRSPTKGVSTAFKRVMSRGRHSEYGPSSSRTRGLLGRTLSLTRSVQRRSSLFRRPTTADRGKDIDCDPEFPEEDKLHPFWRPASFYIGDDLMHTRGGGEGDEEEYYRYPPVDNRPHKPQRSLSARLKKTFAIMPVKDDQDDSYLGAGTNSGPERRTVRRTPSGNLRVVKHRASLESLGQYDAQEAERPYTAPQDGSRMATFWRTASLRKTSFLKKDRAAADASQDRYVAFPRFGDKLSDHGLPSIPRRFSERRREKRSKELRQKISAPQEVRDGVGEVIRHSNYRDAFTQAHMNA